MKKFFYTGFLFVFFVVSLFACERANTIPLTLRSHQDSSKEKKFVVELALDDAQRARGLMYRKSMNQDKGMLFVFPGLVDIPFWMKNTFISLDILFVGADHKIITIIHSAEPESTTRRYSRSPYRYVLEIVGGLSKKIGIVEGDLVLFNL